MAEGWIMVWGSLMFCSKCGEENNDGSNFCKKCGAALNPPGAGDRLSDESATGLEPNVAGFLCYGIWWITGIVFLLVEKEDQFVRFHAMQSIVIFGAIHAVIIALSVFGFIPFVGIVFRILMAVLGLASLGLWVFLMLKAYQGERYKLPYAGEFAERFL